MLIAAGDIFALVAQTLPTYKVDVNVVNVLATVRDRKGNIVNHLSKDDFILEEDGRRQEIQYFSRQTELPLTIGLLIDTSMSQQNLIAKEQSASFQFLDQVLRPDRDRAFVIKFDVEAELLQDLTNSRSLLQKALNSLATPSMRRLPGRRRYAPNSLVQVWPGGQRGPGRGGPGNMAAIGTVLNDSVFLASDELLKEQEGRKAIILISDGVDNGSRISEKEAVESAQRSDALIYCIRFFDENAYGGFGGWGGMGSRGDDALKSLSKETGGRMFEVKKKTTLENIFETIQEELRSQYSLGYTPPDRSGAGFRRISLRTKDGKFKTTARAGYYPKRP